MGGFINMFIFKAFKENVQFNPFFFWSYFVNGSNLAVSKNKTKAFVNTIFN